MESILTRPSLVRPKSRAHETRPDPATIIIRLLANRESLLATEIKFFKDSLAIKQWPDLFFSAGVNYRYKHPVKNIPP